MQPPPTPPTDSDLESKIDANLQKLSSAAQTLNGLSDQLTAKIAVIEDSINKLNLGIRANVNAYTLEGADDDLYSRWVRLAYGKSGNRWGFIVEELTEDLRNPEQDTYDSWAFRDAPREYRLKVVEKIPALLDALVIKSAEIASDIKKSVGYISELESVISKSSQKGSTK